ncbi:MAG TPA: cupin domain-containing protein [Saprospiraceae bacterium]|nr:cupin domain-containing protein [Saprospiraceae bacterium]HNT20744.1 cupin domain-containing protein [Saprospiraceae bacterium]
MKRIIRASGHKEIFTEEKCFIDEIFNQKEYGLFSLARARVEPGVTTALHSVQDTDEVYYILSGTGEVEIDGRIIGEVGAGDLVFIPRNSSQRIKNIAGEDLIFLCVYAPRFDSGNYRKIGP